MSVIILLSSGGMFLRNSLSILGSFFLVAAILKLNPHHKNLYPAGRFVTSAEWGVVLSVEEQGEKTILSLTVKELIMWLLLLASLFSLFLLVYHPHHYEFLAEEDYVVETGTAVVLLACSGIFLRISIMLIRFNRCPSIFIITALVLVLSFFFVGMEEVSWFQRVLDIDTPRAFKGNQQGETNLHNFASILSQQAYYFGAFCLFTILPFLKSEASILQKKFFSFFLPGRFFIFVSTLFMPYDYLDLYFSNAWFLMHFSYFITLFILLYYTWVLRSADNTFLLPTLVFYYLLTTVIIWYFIFQFAEQPWITEEYKELMIGICFLLYSLEILSKSKQLKHLDLQKSPSI
ncbi:MAG: hypothetical protein HYW01_12150 [Deltaproteobacteria bacterium]|nr:hypothetical protein [Deltaproteobacteria bacterium]